MSDKKEETEVKSKGKRGSKANIDKEILGLLKDIVDIKKSEELDDGEKGDELAKKLLEADIDKYYNHLKSSSKGDKKLKDEIKNLKKASEEKENELKDQYVRKVAEFENFRRQAAKQKEEAIKYANSMILGDLVDIIDNLERALEIKEDVSDAKSILDGVKMIENQLVSMLSDNYNLTRFDCVGEDFNPNKHEAVMLGEASEDGKQKVLEVFQKGYMLGDRVLRSAKVKVSAPKAE